MNDKAREMRLQYRRKWYRENKEKVKAYQERYWAKKAAEAEATNQAETESEAVRTV